MSRCFPFPPPGYSQIRGKDQIVNDLIKLQNVKQRVKEVKETKREGEGEKRRAKEVKETKREGEGEKQRVKEVKEIKREDEGEKQRVKEVKEKKREMEEEKQRKKEKKEKKKQRKEEKQRRKEEKQKRKEEKQRRKEEKEKKKEEKRRKEEKDRLSLNLDNPDIVKAHLGQTIFPDTKSLHKKGETKTEQLECSGITEEYGNPFRVPTSSSDSTENSNKRKRDSTMPNAKAIMIRLPLKRPTECDALAKEEQLLCSTSGRIDFPAQNVGSMVSGTNKRSGTNKKSGTKSVMMPVQKMAFQFSDLLGNLFPPPIQDVDLPPEDLDWLFKSKNQERQQEKRLKSGGDGMSYSGRLGLWPCAEYLPEVDVFALPYTVPY